MQARNAAKVFPEPVGAQINVLRRARISGQPCSCGSVGVPNLLTNHSRTSGCAHSSEGTSRSVETGSWPITIVQSTRCETGNGGKSNNNIEQRTEANRHARQT